MDVLLTVTVIVIVINSYSTYLAYLPHRHRHRHRHHSSIIVIIAVHLLFKCNIYLSLYVIGLFLLSKNNFLFLSSKYAVEACDINKCC
jgi:hypothetical protein